jgi:hypothetical protein
MTGMKLNRRAALRGAQKIEPLSTVSAPPRETELRMTNDELKQTFERIA